MSYGTVSYLRFFTLSIASRHRCMMHLWHMHGSFFGLTTVIQLS